MNISAFQTTTIGMSFGQTTAENQLGYPLKLSYLVILLGLEGEATLMLNFKEYHLTKDTIAVLSSDTITLIKHKSGDFKAQCYAIDRTLASEIAYDLPPQLFGFIHDYPIHKLNRQDRKQLRYWDNQLLYMLTYSNIHQRQMIKNQFQNLFFRMADYMNEQGAYKQRKFSRKEELCWKFWDLIGQYAKTQREVAFYADKLHITPFYLAQISKQHLNDQPKDLINRQVILELKTLLRTSEMSIGEIADELHFEDPSYMGRYFRRETGLSMSEYRKL